MSRLLLAALAALALAGAALAETAFAPAAHRNPPQLTYHGWAHKPLRIISFVPANYPNAYGLQEWGNAAAQSTWLFDFTRAYGLPHATPAEGHQVTGMPKLTSHSQASTYQQFVWQQVVKLGIAARPDLQTIYVLYIPCKAPQSLDGFGCVSHHPSIQPKASEPQFTALDSMAVVLGDPSSSTDSKTETASHELAEAATDAYPHGWFLEATDPHRPWLSISPFVEDEGSGHVEVADMAAGSRWVEHAFLTSPRVDTTYSYVRVYANRRAGLGGDPAVPKSPRPYYNVSAKQDWYTVPAGGTRTVTATGWSAAKIPAWTVSAFVISWEGSKAGTAPDPCTIVGKTSWPVANGGTLHFQVKATHGAKGKWCAVKLKSYAAATPDGDYSHPWFVGFHIT